MLLLKGAIPEGFSSTCCIRQPGLHIILWASFSPVTRARPETFVTGRNAPADRIQPGVRLHNNKNIHDSKIDSLPVPTHLELESL